MKVIKFLAVVVLCVIFASCAEEDFGPGQTLEQHMVPKVESGEGDESPAPKPVGS